MTVWGAGGFDILSAWAADSQRQFQGAMARALRALKGGQPGAIATLLSVCFAYGFFHAIGPGHGKVLIGGYGVARRISMGRLLGLALLSSLAQSATAVGLVYGGVALFEWSREQLTDLADTTLQSFSYAAIALVGLWLAWRGTIGLIRRRRAMAHSVSHDHASRHGHGHDHHTHGPHAHVCADCGHAHGPTPEQAAEVRSIRDALILIAGIAIRPCTGALFVLILTWRLEIEAAGIAAAFAMGLGTASVTGAVAIASVSFREGTMLAFADSRGARLILPALELTAGLLVAVIATQFLLRSL